MVNLEINKIDVDRKNIKDLLSQNYSVDHFQRDYKWEIEQLSELINDLNLKYLQEYTEGDTKKDIANYGFYYLGSIILSAESKSYSIIDGQQRLTTLTLLMIYLQNLQNKLKVDKPIDLIELISNDDYDFVPNIGVTEWKDCLEALYEQKEDYDISEVHSSIKNLYFRYNEIDNLFDEKIKTNSRVLKQFINWLRTNVIFSQIITYSPQDAYKIFEAMNDRGLSLTNTEMLKGYLLVKIKDESKQNKLNIIWKKEIDKLNNLRKKEDLKFFSAFFRAKYAETIRHGKKGASNEDFELIGSAFHRWVMQNEKKMQLETKLGPEIFLENIIPFYLKWYTLIYDATQQYITKFENIYYLDKLKLAESIYYPLLLAPLNLDDSTEVIEHKIYLVAKYLEIFVVFRCVNRRNYSQSGIRYTMYSLVKEIRNKSIDELKQIFKQKYSELDVNLNGLNNFILNRQNKPFIKFFLSRITTFIETESGRPTSFVNYISYNQKKPFEIEHIWSDTFEEHKIEFVQRDDFKEFRNKIGALLLIPNGFNQSYNDYSYEKKLPLYYGQNLLAQSLCDKCYTNDPGFLKFKKESGINFKAHNTFNKKDIDERTTLMLEISKKIWSRTAFQ